MMPSRSTAEPIMNPGTSARNRSGTLNASQFQMKRAALSAGVQWRNEAGGLARRVDEQHAAEMRGVVGDDTDRLTTEPGEPDDDLAREQWLQLEERVLVDECLDHLVHV